MVRGGVIAGIVVAGAVVALFGSMTWAAYDRAAGVPTMAQWYQAVDRACVPAAEEKGQARVAYRPDPGGDAAAEKREFERYVATVVAGERTVLGSAERVRVAAGVPAGERDEFLAATRRVVESGERFLAEYRSRAVTDPGDGLATLMGAADSVAERARTLAERHGMANCAKVF